MDAVILDVRCIASGKSFLEGAAISGIDVNVSFSIDWLMMPIWIFGGCHHIRDWCQFEFYNWSIYVNVSSLIVWLMMSMWVAFTLSLASDVIGLWQWECFMVDQVSSVSDWGFPHKFLRLLPTVNFSLELLGKYELIYLWKKVYWGCAWERGNLCWNEESFFFLIFVEIDVYKHNA